MHYGRKKCIWTRYLLECKESLVIIIFLAMVPRMTASITTDFLIVGGGIMGLTIANELTQRYPDSSITIIEKEPCVAAHASGRNSGVLHAGFYYTADSLKAKFCREGNAAWTEFCDTHGLTINKCGKVVIAQNEQELDTLYELKRRGEKNGVAIEQIDTQQLAEIEPNAVTTEHALYTPATAVVDPTECCEFLAKQLEERSVRFLFQTPYLRKLDKQTIRAGSETIAFGTLINCAGLYADKIAADFDAGLDYTIIPFKGVYVKYAGDAPPVRTNIYPVPSLDKPFLGVHFTVTAHGDVKIGPTAIPAFWREQYGFSDNFSARELASIVGWEAKLFTTNAFGFRSLAFEEMKKYSKSYLVNQAANMVKSMDRSGFSKWARPGIRAQLLKKQSLELVQDFVVEKGEHSIHVLNAVSPAFTCSLPFSAWVLDEYLDAQRPSEQAA